jgi:hypothetical protein
MWIHKIPVNYTVPQIYFTLSIVIVLPNPISFIFLYTNTSICMYSNNRISSFLTERDGGVTVDIYLH